MMLVYSMFKMTVTDAACKKGQLLEQVPHLRGVHMLVPQNHYPALRD